MSRKKLSTFAVMMCCILLLGMAIYSVCYSLFTVKGVVPGMTDDQVASLHGEPVFRSSSDLVAQYQLADGRFLNIVYDYDKASKQCYVSSVEIGTEAFP